MKKIILKKGREKSINRKHPWVFSGAIDKTDSDISLGETVHLFSSNNKFLAVGAYSPHSQIRVRIWSFNDVKIDEKFFSSRIQAAIHFRKNTIDRSKYNSYRLINSESDGLPGVIVDKYDDVLVCQFISAGAEKFKKEIVTILADLIKPEAIFERSDVEARNKEGLKNQSGILFGKLENEIIKISEDKFSFYVDIKSGHKTGFYLDQRENRKIVSEYCQNKNVLNCFSYTGGFGIAAALQDAAHVLNLDSSQESLDLSTKNFELNNIDKSRYSHEKADVFNKLRELKKNESKFDIIILDPPKFVEGKGSLNRASRGYKDINMLAMQLLNQNGYLFTFSCSGLMTPELFSKIVADAALDANANMSIVKRLWQSVDHRVTTNFPEGLYLKGLVLRKD